MYAQECDSGYVWVEDVPSCCGAAAEHCFYESDINILQTLIDNSENLINLEMDDNGDGMIEAVELGLSEWVDGRLVALDCYLSDIMNCNLSGSLPENFGDLEKLEALWLNGNQLNGEIPVSFGNLVNLELLYLSNNNISGSIPDSFCNLNVDFYGSNNWDVEYFNIWGNKLCPPLPECLDSEVLGAQNCNFFSGDVNLDGIVNILDILMIANIILGTQDYVLESDVNQDDNVNIIDIITIVTIILE